jgi:hypothetical protein
MRTCVACWDHVKQGVFSWFYGSLPLLSTPRAKQAHSSSSACQYACGVSNACDTLFQLNTTRIMGRGRLNELDEHTDIACILLADALYSILPRKIFMSSAPTTLEHQLEAREAHLYTVCLVCLGLSTLVLVHSVRLSQCRPVSRCLFTPSAHDVTRPLAIDSPSTSLSSSLV